jgi:ABC-2 type transport system ATP-binding protein
MPDDDSALLVTGAPAEDIGDLSARNGITLHELSPRPASLEESYMKLTDDAVEYRAVPS